MQAQTPAPRRSSPSTLSRRASRTRPGFPLSDDQDPNLLTEAGLLFARHLKVLERAFVGAELARLAWAARFDTGLVGKDDPFYLLGEGATDALDLVAGGQFPALWRGVDRLERIAARVLLGRAGSRLRANPNEEDARLLVDAARAALARPPTIVPGTRR